jgi:hypothetical protein
MKPITLLNELIDAIRDDTENRQDVKELIRTIREAAMKKGIIACSVAAIISLAATLWPQALRTSPEAQLKMAKYEDCRKTPYYCPAGVLTVGIGSTGKVQNRQYAERDCRALGE